MKNLNEWLSTKVAKPMKHTGDPVESDTVLKIGDIVRIKDKEWFDSLEKNKNGMDRIASVDKNGIVMNFANSMKRFFGCEVTIKKICNKSEYAGDFYPVYRLELLNKKDNDDIKHYLFTNEMLEYI